MTHPIVFVIDDEEEVRVSLSQLLGVLGYSVEAFGSADAFLREATESCAGCVLTDVRMPGTDGIELVREIARRGMILPTVLMSGHADVAMAVEGIKAGACDFVCKPLDDVKLVMAINSALDEAAERESTHNASQSLRAGFELLTRREIEVFDLVVAGFTSYAIADKLHISQRTVESYRTAVMNKMRAPGVAVLVRQAVRLGRLSP